MNTCPLRLLNKLDSKHSCMLACINSIFMYYTINNVNSIKFISRLLLKSYILQF